MGAKSEVNDLLCQFMLRLMSLYVALPLPTGHARLRQRLDVTNRDVSMMRSEGQTCGLGHDGAHVIRPLQALRRHAGFAPSGFA